MINSSNLKHLPLPPHSVPVLAYPSGLSMLVSWLIILISPILKYWGAPGLSLGVFLSLTTFTSDIILPGSWLYHQYGDDSQMFVSSVDLSPESNFIYSSSRSASPLGRLRDISALMCPKQVSWSASPVDLSHSFPHPNKRQLHFSTCIGQKPWDRAWLISSLIPHVPSITTSWWHHVQKLLRISQWLPPPPFSIFFAWFIFLHSTYH